MSFAAIKQQLLSKFRNTSRMMKRIKTQCLPTVTTAERSIWCPEQQVESAPAMEGLILQAFGIALPTSQLVSRDKPRKPIKLHKTQTNYFARSHIPLSVSIKVSFLNTKK